MTRRAHLLITALYMRAAMDPTTSDAIVAELLYPYPTDGGLESLVCEAGEAGEFDSFVESILRRYHAVGDVALADLYVASRIYSIEHETTEFAELEADAWRLFEQWYDQATMDRALLSSTKRGLYEGLVKAWYL